MAGEVTIQREIAQISDEIKKITSASRDAQGELRQVNQALRLDPNNVELTNQKFDIFRKQLDLARQRSAELDKQIELLNRGLADGTYTQEQYNAKLAQITKQKQALEIQTKGLSGAIDNQGKVIAQAQLKYNGMAQAAKNLHLTMSALNSSVMLMSALTNDVPRHVNPAVASIKLLTGAIGAAATAWAIKKGTMTLGAAVPAMIAAAGAAAMGIRGLLPRTDELSTPNLNVPRFGGGGQVTHIYHSNQGVSAGGGDIVLRIGDREFYRESLDGLREVIRENGGVERALD